MANEIINYRLDPKMMREGYTVQYGLYWDEQRVRAIYLYFHINT